MRLISCIGILMVVPAVALLTRKYDEPQVSKTPAINIHRSDKSHQVKAKLVVSANSNPLLKTDQAAMSVSDHPGYSAGSDAHASPLFTKQ